jgi:hypothetical protein
MVPLKIKLPGFSSRGYPRKTEFFRGSPIYPLALGALWKGAMQPFYEVLSKMANKRYHAPQYQDDAHQIIEDFRKNQYHDTEDEADYSSNQT